MDPISSQAAGAVAKTEVTQPLSGPGPARADDVARFQDSMHQPPQQNPQQLPDAGQSFQPAQAAQTDAPGASNKVLDGLDKVSSDIRSMRTDMIADSGNLGDMGELIRVQFQVANLTMTQTMMGQAGQKSSQGMQQLLKGQ
jgi:hypothetical protein